MIVSIRMNDKESKLAEAYAKLKGSALEELSILFLKELKMKTILL